LIPPFGGPTRAAAAALKVLSSSRGKVLQGTFGKALKRRFSRGNPTVLRIHRNGTVGLLSQAAQTDTNPSRIGRPSRWIMS